MNKHKKSAQKRAHFSEHPVSCLKDWSHPPGSNRRPADYESAGLLILYAIVLHLQALIFLAVALNCALFGTNKHKIGTLYCADLSAAKEGLRKL